MWVVLFFGLMSGLLVHAEGSSLKQSCSYSSTDRTVRCDGVTSEVRIYRSGEQSDRDIRYFSSPFQFQLGEREVGTYRVALVEASADGGIHSDLFEFHVDKSTRVADGEFDLHVILGLAIPLAVFLVLPLAGIDIIVRVWKEQHQPQKPETSENIPLTSISSQHRDQEQQWTNMNGQHSVPTEPFSEDSDAQA